LRAPSRAPPTLSISLASVTGTQAGLRAFGRRRAQGNTDTPTGTRAWRHPADLRTPGREAPPHLAPSPPRGDPRQANRARRNLATPQPRRAMAAIRHK